MIRYCRDQRAEEIIPHVAGRQQIVAHLQYPSEVCDRPGGASDDELLAALTKEPPVEDDEEGSLKTARIDAKKREMALELTAKEQRVVRRGAVNKELAEGFLLNRAHRLEVRDQSEAMFRVQNQTIAMSERTLALIEKIQEGMGRVAELEKSVAQRAATPPPPIDYTPVLHGVVSAIRDISVSALQREHKPKPRAEEEAAPVKAALADKPATPAQVSGSEQSIPVALGASPTAPALTAAPAPSSPTADQPTVAELLARLARLEAERERMASELAAERRRQEVLSELSAGVPAPKTPMRSEPSIQSGSAQSEKTASMSAVSGESPLVEDETYAHHILRRSPPQRTAEPSAVEELEEDDRQAAQAQPARPAQRTPRQPTEPRARAESGPASEGVPKKSGRAEESERSAGSADPTPLAIEPVMLPPRAVDAANPFTPRTSRNAPCLCGSGRKYKKCCLPKDEQAAFREVAAARQRAPRETAPAQPATENKIAGTPASALPAQADAPPSGPVGSREGLATRSAAQSAAPATGTKANASETPPSPRAEPSKAAAPSSAPVTLRHEEAGSRTSPAASGKSGSQKTETPSAPPEVVPGVLGEHVQELLVNAIAGRMLANPDPPISPPQVPRVDLVEQVIVTPSKMDPETAVKLLKDGTALETLGAFLFFNPAVRDLLSRRGK